MEKTAEGKVVLFCKSTGQRYERWPVDARDMIASGDYRTLLEQAKQLADDYALNSEPKDPAANPTAAKPQIDGSSTKAEDEDPAPSLTGGYKVVKSGQWYKAFDPDGKQIGKSVRTEEEALDLVPAVFHVGGTANGNVEHSPGVPLVVSPSTGA